MTMIVTLTDSLTLPCGLVLPNRLVKASMTEGLANGNNEATEALETLYRRWARSGIGLQLTGNVLVDRRYLEQPGNVVIEGQLSNQEIDALTRYAEAAKSGGGKVIMQISHAGRQTPELVSREPIAPSAVQLNMQGQKLNPFGVPRAMTGEDVQDVIERFVKAIIVAEKTGFDGVQIHGAHGYLISQFLSPKSNLRTDDYGGTLENRARLLLDIIRKGRQAVSPGFAIGVKLNSSDFQKGGFSHEDCLAVIDLLNEAKIDFVEVSGGNYEQPQMMGIDGEENPADSEPLRASTAAREAYFVDYAKSVKEHANMPVMATGGFRTRAAMNAALEAGQADLIGLARPLCGEPDLPKGLIQGTVDRAYDWDTSLRLGPTRWLGINSPITFIKMLNGWGQQGWYREQIARMGRGDEPNVKLGLLSALTKMQSAQKKSAAAYHDAMKTRVPSD